MFNMQITNESFWLIFLILILSACFEVILCAIDLVGAVYIYLNEKVVLKVTFASLTISHVALALKSFYKLFVMDMQQFSWPGFPTSHVASISASLVH